MLLRRLRLRVPAAPNSRPSRRLAKSLIPRPRWRRRNSHRLPLQRLQPNLRASLKRRLRLLQCPAPVSVSASEPSAGADDVPWIWPASGKVIGQFSEAGSKGLDIGGKAGDAVIAAGDGKVVYAGTGLRGYGKLIIVKHNATFLSAYAHNQNLLVKEGQTVSKGQKIAEMGNTDADQVKLHFEVRRQGKPVDPMKYLPPR
jgi:murein DD-endopeptidase MepM/ murein hydrolase activator NlpD